MRLFMIDVSRVNGEGTFDGVSRRLVYRLPYWSCRRNLTAPASVGEGRAKVLSSKRFTSTQCPVLSQHNIGTGEILRLENTEH